MQQMATLAQIMTNTDDFEPIFKHICKIMSPDLTILQKTLDFKFYN